MCCVVGGCCDGVFCWISLFWWCWVVSISVLIITVDGCTTGKGNNGGGGCCGNGGGGNVFVIIFDCWITGVDGDELALIVASALFISSYETAFEWLIIYIKRLSPK